MHTLPFCSLNNMKGTCLLWNTRTASVQTFHLSRAAHTMTTGQSWIRLFGVAFISVTECLQKWQDFTVRLVSLYEVAAWQLSTEGQSRGGKAPG